MPSSQPDADSTLTSTSSEGRVYLRAFQNSGDRYWEVYLIERNGTGAEAIGLERFEHEKVARLYAAELLRLFRAERLVEV